MTGSGHRVKKRPGRVGSRVNGSDPVAFLPPPLMRWLQLRFDFDSTAVRLLIKGHQGHSDVTR